MEENLPWEKNIFFSVRVIRRKVCQYQLTAFFKFFIATEKKLFHLWSEGSRRNVIVVGFIIRLWPIHQQQTFKWHICGRVKEKRTHDKSSVVKQDTSTKSSRSTAVSRRLQEHVVTWYGCDAGVAEVLSQQRNASTLVLESASWPSYNRFLYTCRRKTCTPLGHLVGWCIRSSYRGLLKSRILLFQSHRCTFLSF